MPLLRGVLAKRRRSLDMPVLRSTRATARVSQRGTAGLRSEVYVLDDGGPPSWPGEYSIDMDAVADAVGKEAEKPEFYYAEESQQKKFFCSACGEFNDILGNYGFCSGCGTRNDYDEL